MNERFQAGSPCGWHGRLLLVVFAAYLAVALGLGGPGVLDVFSTLGLHRARTRRGRAARAARLHRDDRRAPWLALSLGAAMWAIGELIYEIAYSEAPDLAPYPSVADAFWLGAYVAVGTGIVLVLRARLRRAFHADDVARRRDRGDDDRGADGDDRVRPVLADTAARLEVATDLAYPLADLGLLALV